MNFKLYDREDTLMFAEESDESDEDTGEDEGGGDSKDDDGKSDIDKLRASQDKTIAELQKQIKALQERTSQEDSTYVVQTARSQAEAEVKGVLDRIAGEKDPAKALELAKAALSGLAPKYGDARANHVYTGVLLKQAKASGYAAQLQAEFGGDQATYQAKLGEATTMEKMEAEFFKLQLELAKNSNKSKGRNGERQPPRMDQGRGSPARTNVLSEMEDIDVTTPEGAKKWQENRDKFRKKLAV